MTDAHSSPQASRSVGGRASNGLLRYFVEHRTAANLLLALMLMAGVAAGLQIRSQFFPDVVIESITVRVPWDGAGPEDVDRSIVAALEPRLLAVDGVESMRAQAQEGRASITLEFEPGWDMSVAIDEVKTAVDETTTLPDEADDPRITLGRFRDLVTNIVLAGPRTPDQLDLYAQELKSRLFQAGVSRVTVQGVRDPQIRVEPSEASLERYGLTLREIADRVAAEVEARPAGELDNGAGRVRAGEERKSVDRLGAVSVRTLPDGSRLLLRDVAVIRERGAESGVAFFRDGQPAVQLRVERDAEGDSIGIQRTVEQVVETYRPALPADVETVLTRTRSQAILDRLDILWRNGLTGLGIVLVLLFLFLSARTAFWVSAGIPAAMMATIAFMWAFGLSLNMVSLFALIICLGIVVDDAIVVGEHADRLARDGLPPADAASVAATRMAAPVFSASVTTVIAFLALVVIGGRFGELIADLPRTVALVILASLVECFVILPAHMRHALAAQARGAAAGARARTVAWWDRPSLYVNRWFETVREQGLRPLMRWATRQRYPVLAGALALLAFTLAMRFDNTVRWRFWSAPERGVVQANVMMLSGATREDTFAMLEEMRRALEETDRALAAEHGRAPVTDAIAKLGATSGRGLSGEDTRDPDQLGSLSIELIDPDFRPYSQGDFVRLWRSRIEEHPLLETLAVRGERSGPGGDAIEIELTGGADARTLKAAAEALKARLAALPGVSALEDSLPYDAAELVLTLTPKGEALGFTTQTLGAELRARLAGITAAQFPRGAREAEIQVALPEQTLDAAFLYRTRVPIPSAGGATIALTEVAEIERRPSFGVIQ
ncbi:MAG: efflux RND transporter permease subunit, partial [Pseudomonadota bacterium]